MRLVPPFRILVVCTGNICRSPMAQAMLTHELRDRLGPDADRVEVSSAGTGALVGEPMEPFALQSLENLGIKSDGFAARDVEPLMLKESDLILTATRQHRSLVVTAEPSVVRRTFTIKEFARLAASLGNFSMTDPHDLVVRAGGQRGMVPPESPDDDDVADPYLQPQQRFTETAAELQSAVAVVAEAVAAARVSAG
jgi:protein-tyrosine phosphatase